MGTISKDLIGFSEGLVVLFDGLGFKLNILERPSESHMTFLL